MSTRSIYNVAYDIPRPNLSFAATQNRAKEGVLRMSPGLYEPIEFHFSNIDGVPINLAQFTVRFIAWTVNRRDSNFISNSDTKIVFSKDVEIIDAYQGSFVMLLDDSDTLALSRCGQGTLRWSLALINQDQQVFPAQVNSSGSRWGQLILDLEGGYPSTDYILGQPGDSVSV